MRKTVIIILLRIGLPSLGAFTNNTIFASLFPSQWVRIGLFLSLEIVISIILLSPITIVNFLICDYMLNLLEGTSKKYEEQLRTYFTKDQETYLNLGFQVHKLKRMSEKVFSYMVFINFFNGALALAFGGFCVVSFIASGNEESRINAVVTAYIIYYVLWTISDGIQLFGTRSLVRRSLVRRSLVRRSLVRPFISPPVH
jgi:hypothetical protein